MKIRLPFDRFHVEALENWLNTQAGKGLMLVQMSRFSAEFREEEGRIQYHIDSADAVMKERLSEAGWQEISSLDGAGEAAKYLTAALYTSEEELKPQSVRPAAASAAEL